MPKYPDVEVELTGQDGNVFSIIGAVNKALRRHGVPQAERDEFFNEVTSQGSYNKALVVVMNWVNVS